MPYSNLKFKIAVLLGLIAGTLLAALYLIPAFRGDITISSGFSFGDIVIHYYGLTIALAILASYLVARRLASQSAIPMAQLETALLWIVIFGLLGARLYYAVFTWQYFSVHPAEIWQIWKGGLSIYGAVIGGAFGLWLYCKKNHLPLGNFFDLAATVLPLGQAIGRFGNFFNQEAFGRPTDLPWGLHISAAHRPLEFLESRFFHPTFLYESLWNLLVFAVLWKIFIASRRSRPGYLLGIYLILYSMGRFFIEGLRLDSFFWEGLRIDQITALVMILTGLLIIIKTRKTVNDA